MLRACSASASRWSVCDNDNYVPPRRAPQGPPMSPLIPTDLYQIPRRSEGQLPDDRAANTIFFQPFLKFVAQKRACRATLR
jgi:hypothetical protein